MTGSHFKLCDDRKKVKVERLRSHSICTGTLTLDSEISATQIEMPGKTNEQRNLLLLKYECLELKLDKRFEV